MQRSLMTDFGKLAGLAVLAGLAGIVSNLARHQPVPWSYVPKETRLAEAVASISGSSAGPIPADMEGIGKIKLDQVIEAVRDGQAGIIDARQPLFFRMGHLPGAINLPRERFQNAYPAFPELARDKQRLIIIYCERESCEDSSWVAKGLKALGHGRILVFPEGWQAWRASGQRVETEP